MRQSRKISTSVTFRSVVLYLASVVVLFGGAGGLLLGCKNETLAKRVGNVEVEGRTYAELRSVFGEEGEERDNAPNRVGVVYYSDKWIQWGNGIAEMGEGFNPVKKEFSRDLAPTWWAISAPFEGTLHGIRVGETPQAVLARFGDSLDPEGGRPSYDTGGRRWVMFREKTGGHVIGWTTESVGWSYYETNKIQDVYFH